MTRKRIHFWCLFSMVLSVLSSCSKKEDTPAPIEDATQTEPTVEEKAASIPQQELRLKQRVIEVHIPFDKVLAIWESGEKEQAVRSFFGVNWSRPDVFVSGSIFGISEAQFVKLPTGQRLELRKKAIEAVKAIKEMTKFMTEQAKQTNAGVEYRRALLACGQRLSADDQLAMIQMAGEAVTDYVEKELPSGN